jgi:NADP-dependent 3-hydroxy acid dehydrogenase YdfG
MGTPSIVDKVVVITGASSGIGESTARLLAGNGAKVVLGARRTDRIDALVKDITAKGGSALASQTDVAKRGEVEALVQGAIDKHGRIDVIVNNAGIMPIAPMAALKVEEWDQMIDVNIKGLLFGVAAVLPIMQKQKQGHIINMSSVGGFKVWAPGGTVYSATKFAVRAITEGFAHGAQGRQYSMHHNLAWCGCYRASGKQFGRRHQKEFARVLQSSGSGRLSRSCDRLRHRATSRSGRQRDRHPAYKAGLLADE